MLFVAPWFQSRFEKGFRPNRRGSEFSPGADGTARVEWLRPLFWLEAIAQAAFGAAWLIKGETFLKDRAI